jgi:hypothetical protein
MGAARALLWLLDPPSPPFRLYQVGLGCTDLAKKIFSDLRVAPFSQKKRKLAEK